MSAKYSADGSVSQPAPRLDFIGEMARHDLAGLYIAAPGYRIARHWREADRGNVLVVCAGANHPDQFAGAAASLALCDAVILMETTDPVMLLWTAHRAVGGENVAIVETTEALCPEWVKVCGERTIAVLCADGELIGLDTRSSREAAQ